MPQYIYTENQRGPLDQSRVIYFITDMHNGNIFQGKKKPNPKHYHLGGTGLTAEVSRTDRVFVFLSQKGQIQRTSLRIAIPARGGLLGYPGGLQR